MKTTRIRVMIVEAHPAHAEAIRKALKGSGTVWDIRVARSLKEYHEGVASKPPDIVLMGMDLPDGRAMDALTAPPEDAPFPILIMTSHGDEKTAVEAMKSGALDYIVKSPEAFAETPRILVRALREWSLHKKAKRKDEELRQSEERYRTITENMSDTVWVMDLDFKTTYISPSVLRTRGFTLEELQALPLDRHMTPESFKLASQVLAEEMTPKKLAKKDLVISRQLELEFYRKDGTTFWGDVVMTLVRDAEGRPREIIGIGRDITEKRKFEGALKKAAEEWRATFDSITDLISIQDADYRIVRVSKSLADFLKMKPKDLIGKHCYEVIHGTKQPPSFCPHKKVFETKKSIEEEIFEPRLGMHMHLADSPIMDEKGDVVGSVHVLKNITERKRAEEELRKLASIVRYSSELVSLATFEGKMIFLNESGCRMLGIESADIELHNIIEVIPEHLIATVQAELLPALKAGGTWGGELQYRNIKTGMVTDVQASCFVIRDTDTGSPICIANISRDITERKRAEEALRESDIRFKKLSSNVPGMIYQFLKRPDGTFCVPFTSEAIKDIFGCSPQDVREDFSPIARVILPEDLDKVVDSIEASAERMTVWQCEYRVQIPGRPLKWLFGQSTPEKLADGSIIWHGFNTDITEPKRAEETLRESEANLSTAQRIAGVGSWDWDLTTNQLVWSAETFRIFGRDVNEYTPNVDDALSSVHPDDREFLEQKVRTSIEHDQAYEHDYRIVDTAGDIKYLHAVGEIVRDEKRKPIRLRGAIQDITRRKRAEEAVRESERDLKKSQQIAHLGSWRLDIETNQVAWTEELYKMYGFDPTLAPPPYTEHMKLFTPESWERLSTSLANTRETGIPYELELETVRKDGSNGWMWARGEAIRDSKGNINGLWGAAQDITDRKRVEEALVASETRYRRLFEAAKDGILILDADTGLIMDVNPFIETILGYSHEELLGKELWEIGFFKDIAENREGFLQLQDKGYIRYEDLPLQTKDGKTVSVEFVSNVYLVNHTKVVQCNIRDITQRKAAEEALKKEQQDIMLILDSSPNVIFYTDKEGKYIRVNKTFAMSLGRTEEEIVGKTVFDLFSPEDAQRMSESNQEVMRSGRPELNRTEYHESAGGIRWLQVDKIPIYDANNNVIGLAGFAQDITQRKAAEEALRESEERFKQVAESAGEWIWEVNADGLYTYASPIVEKILGYKPEEIVGKKYFYDFFLPEEKKAFKAASLAAFADKRPLREFINRNVHKSGETIWLSTSGSPLLDDKGNLIGFRGTDTDITERKRAEEALKESEERYRELVENIEDIVYVADGTGKIIFLNNAFTRISGYTLEEMLRKNYMELLTPESLKDVLVLFKKQKKGQDMGVFEMSFINKDRTVMTIEVREKHILEGGRVVEVHGLGRDVTDRKRAEEALKESEEKFRSLFKTSRDFLSISNLEGTIIEVNDAALEFFGYSSEEISRTLMYDLYADPEDRQKLIHAVLESGYVENKEIRMKKKDGEIIDTLVTANLIRDNRGKPIGFFGSARDVTEKRKLEQQLLQSEKLSAVGTMISGVAHELNNPLTSIIGNAQLLAKRDVPEDIKNKLGVILKESIRSSKIVAGLLAFAREHKPERKMIDIGDILMESVKLREYDVKVSNIDMRVSLSENIPKIYADPYQLQQVFINLINNARDVLVGQQSAGLSIRTYRKDDDVLIEFEDNGPGIPDKITKKIFDPFFTTKEVGKGTGLGLSMAYGIVKEHDGMISVESEPTKGAKFTVTLPIRDGIQPAVGTAKTAVKPPPGTRTVLVVEDEASLRDLLMEALTDDGFFVESASTGDEAISLVEERKYDAIISDIKMPGIGGKELYLYIQKNHPEIADKIIFITGDILSKDTQSFLQITNNRFIEKPFNIDALAALLNDMLAG